MKITIEFDEDKMSKRQAIKSTLDSIESPTIIKNIKPNKNVKIVWYYSTLGVLTQQGTHMVLYRK